ncbi:MAG: DegV family protein [Lachnospiraceae bacterium]
MSKIAIATDSNSGITQKLAGELGVFVLPMPFTIDGATFFEDINLSTEEFFEALDQDKDVMTSQPNPVDLTEFWDSILKEYDSIVYIPMSSGLSGSCQTAMMLAEEYEGRIQVVDNQRISVTMRHSIEDAQQLIELGYDAAAIKQILEEDRFRSSIYIMLDTLYYLKKGGRITPAAAALGTILRLKPVLQIQGEKLDAYAKARTVTQAKTIMTNAIQNDIEKRFSGDYRDMKISIAYTRNIDAAIAFREELKAVFPEAEINIDHLSLSVSCHIGAGALALACSCRLHKPPVR